VAAARRDADEDVILAEDGRRRRDLLPILLALVRPEHRSVLRIDADGAALREQRDVLAHAADLDRNRRGVGALLRHVLALPLDGAGLLVEGGDQSVRPARRDDEVLAIDQWRPREAPAEVLGTAAYLIDLGVHLLRQ